MTPGPVIVVVTERQLFPVSEGTRTRIVGLVRDLRELGFRVVLVVRRPSGLLDAMQTRLLADRVFFVDARGFGGGSPSAYDCTPFERQLRSAVERFSPIAVIAEYVWMAPCLHAAGAGAVRMVDTIDLMHVRRDFRDRLSNVWVTCTPEEERRLLEAADVVMAIQPRELAQFRELVPNREVICVPHHVAVWPHEAAAGRRIVMLVGSGNPSNVDGLLTFLDRGWPVVLDECPDAELRVYGHLACAAPDRPHVVRAGYVKRLSSAYRDAAVVINPVRVGTGLKIKTVEALAHAKALVTTSCGAEGIGAGAACACIVEDDPPQFGAAVASLLRDTERRAALELSAARFARAEFRLDRVYQSFLESLARAVPALRQGGAGAAFQSAVWS